MISFLPTLYAAYSDRERGVGLLEPLVGSPPSAVELLRRLRVAQSVDGSSVWGPVSQWFVAVAQSHTAFPALCSFPSQQPGLPWVVTAGTVLDSAALRLSLHRDSAAPLSLGRDTDAAKDTARRPAPTVLVLAHGVPAITRVSRSAGFAVPEPPGLMELLGRSADEPPQISVTREEYDAAVVALVANGIGEAPDREAADLNWHRFRWLRSGYDRAITGLAGYTHAPGAPWTSDRALAVGRPRFFSRKPLATRPMRSTG